MCLVKVACHFIHGLESQKASLFHTFIIVNFWDIPISISPLFLLTGASYKGECVKRTWKYQNGNMLGFFLFFSFHMVNRQDVFTRLSHNLIRHRLIKYFSFYCHSQVQLKKTFDKAIIHTSNNARERSTFLRI